ncbi:C-C motif chemokine 20-like [Gastrophryne carolinensis]
MALNRYPELTMASYRHLPLSLALLVVVLGVSQAFGSYDCCIRYSNKKVHQKAIDKYYWQMSNGVCDIEAVVFEVRISPCNPNATIKVCADPKEKWVQDHIEAVDKRTKRTQRKMLKRLEKKCKALKKLLV